MSVSIVIAEDHALSAAAETASSLGEGLEVHR